MMHVFPFRGACRAVVLSISFVVASAGCSDVEAGDASQDSDDEGTDDGEFRSHGGWHSDGRTFYRAATSSEIVANEWPVGTYLVLYPPANVRANLELPVVVGATSLQYVSLVAAGTTTGTQFHELSFASTVTSTTTPTFYRYNSVKGSTIKGHVTTDGGGGLYSRVTVATGTNRAREVLANERNASLQAIALPSGGVPAASDLLVVFTPPGGGGLPGASDTEAVPVPDDPYSMVLFGNMLWCQNHPTNWKSLIAETSFEIRAGFRNDAPGPGDTDSGIDFTLAKSWCMFWNANDNSQAAIDEAQWCEWGKEVSGNQCIDVTCLDGQGRPYPFDGCWKLGECYNDNVWNAVEYADHYLPLPNIMIAQVQIQGGLQTVGAESPDCPSESADGPFICGIGKYPWADELAGASAVPGRPYSEWPPMFPGLDNCSTPYTWTHEIGHNFSADHYVEYDDAPNGSSCTDYHTVMNTVVNPPAGTCKVNWFGAGPVGDAGTKDYMLANCNPAECPRSAPYVDQH